ncbi:UNVERIFIED_CONTAM: hypothetical protein Slati_3681100 [Sesamum latifolium]|uniref:Integrase catalytic domain-containing protein n=1 Tax=Sesamum latifolium TaxID=2727402 RepID=A0AAW2U274_9LAMI
MLQDAHGLVRRCRACQEHANVNHQPDALMQPLESPCPSDQWGLDLVGPFPQATGQRKFLIVAVDYFTKSVEAEALAKISEKEVIKFLWKNIICRFGIPRALRRGAWADELPSVLWAYRTTLRTATRESPFSLSYGTEAVAPAEIGEISWRVKHYNSNSNEQGLRMNLDLVEETRERAAVRAAMYKARMAKAYNERVRPRSFQVGDLVMRKAEASGPIRKLDPKWEGPYKVVEIVNAGAYKLQKLDGKNTPLTWNIANLKKYYS